MIASHATGWCGLVATRLAPALWNKYYLALCALFVLVGLRSDYYVAGRRTDPVAASLGRTRALLKEYVKERRAKPESQASPEDTDEDGLP